jgi:hypothetical protein
LLCTHSVTAAASTDRVIMLADGVVAETGPFNELVAKRGAFYELAKSHLGDAAKPCADTAAAAAEAHAAHSPGSRIAPVATTGKAQEPAQEISLPPSDSDAVSKGSDAAGDEAMPVSISSIGSALSAGDSGVEVRPASLSLTGSAISASTTGGDPSSTDSFPPVDEAVSALDVTIDIAAVPAAHSPRTYRHP